MFENAKRQDIVMHFAKADARLMHELAATHGLAFAAAFRIDYANEVANAIVAVVERGDGQESGNMPHQCDMSLPRPVEQTQSLEERGMAELLQSVWRVLILAPSFIATLSSYSLSGHQAKKRVRARHNSQAHPGAPPKQR